MDETTASPPAPDVEIPTRVLVLGMAHHDGTIVATELHPVADACGLTSDQVRSCLRRLVSERLFTREGDGRDAIYRATEAGMRALGSTMERTRLAYAQDAAGRGWDRTWHLVAFAIPEAKRAARDAFRDHLLDLGGAAIQNGLYVSPHRWEKDVVAEAERLGVVDNVTLASTEELEVGGERDPRAVAARLWPIDRVAGRYQRFVDVYAGVPDELERMRRNKERLAEADFLPGSLIIGIKFQECFSKDPLLPPELLPRPWPGRQARELLARSRRLGILVREEHNKPALFAPFDDIVETIP
ncbi:MAG TPA: PaaX family transcriptional regulator C-terminal domain-containing protein [Acidimicrobiales bacterium]